jgi:hypothetical protein
MKLPKFLQGFTLLSGSPDNSSFRDNNSRTATSEPAAKPGFAAQAPFNKDGGRDARPARREQTPDVAGSQPSTGNSRSEDPERPFFNFRPQPDLPFHQHDFHTRAEFLRMPKTPRILISDHAYRRMCLIVECAHKEVGWLGTVERMESGNFYIDEIFVPEQVVSGAETDPTDEGQYKVMNALAEMGEEGMKKIERLRFWGHSHVHMMTSPSSTDENTPLRYQRMGLSWFIRGIFNKHGRAEFTVYLFEEGHRFIDVPWVAVDAKTGEEFKIRAEERHGAFKSRNSTWGSTPHESHDRQNHEAHLLDGREAADRSEEAGISGWSSRHEELPFALPKLLQPSQSERQQVKSELAAKLTERSFGFFGRRHDTADGATPDFRTTERPGISRLTDGEE